METVTVRFGPALLFTDDSNSSLQWAEDIVIDPKTDVGPWDEPVNENGCWRFPEGGARLVRSSIETRGIEPDHSIGESYDIYTSGDAVPCLPEGTYLFQDPIETGAGAVVLTLKVAIDEGQQISSTGEIRPLERSG